MKTYKPGGAGHGTPAHAEANEHGNSTGQVENEQAQPFPLHVLNDTMRAIAEATAEVHQIPIELPAMAAVATMAGALGKSCELVGAVNGKTSFGNIYVIAGAPKSTGKGAASHVASPLLLASHEMGRDFRENDLPDLKVKKEMLRREAEALYKEITKPETSEGRKQLIKERLVEIQRESDALEPLLVGQPTYWVSNATSEAMASQFARNNCSLFAFSPEGGEPVRVMMGKYRGDNKGDFDLWLSGYTVEIFRTDRVQRGTIEIVPCLSALLFCQPSVLRELITNEEAFERGLTARTLPFIVEPKLIEDDGKHRAIADTVNERWNALIGDVLVMRGNPGDPPEEPRRLYCSEGGREVFRAFHNESIRLRNGKYRDIEGELGRWRENAIRLSVGQCLADDLNATELTEAQAMRAVELARWCVLSALGIMHAGRMERRLKRVREVQSLLVMNYGGTQTLRELERRHGVSHKEAIQLAEDFPDLLTYRKAETGKPGRPAETLSTIKGSP